MAALLKNLKSKTESQKVPQRPVWKGPEQDGITFSLLSRFLACRERFRALVVEGLKPTDEFNHRIEYGSMWHVCEEAFAAGGNPIVNNPMAEPPWAVALRRYSAELCQRYPTQQGQIDHWYNICRVQFPIYVDWWAKHPDVMERTPLLQEVSFNVPYLLPSGRIVRLRGKWDSVDLIGKGKIAGIYLQENKTKGDIDEMQLRRQLASGFDLQTMLYLVALQEFRNDPEQMQQSAWKSRGYDAKVLGVRYNVVRRPLSGGKGSIKQHQPTKSNPRGESSKDFYNRLVGVIKEDPGHYFMRWKIEISPGDVTRFRRECLDPILEQLCDWWEWITRASFTGSGPDPFRPVVGRMVKLGGLHFRFPFGVYNPLLEGRASDLDNYLASGSEIGLQRTDNLFPELM